MRWRRRRQGRAELIDRKHRLEGEINVLRAELRRSQHAGENTDEIERRLTAAQQRHYETRLQIDRTSPD